MYSSGVLQKHWFNVMLRVALDALLFFTAFLVATELRLGTTSLTQEFVDYLPSIFWGAAIFPCVLYVMGLYSPQVGNDTLLERMLMLAASLLITLTAMLLLFYVNFSGRIGRGVMIPGILLAFGFVAGHHAHLFQHWRNYRERMALIVANPFDEDEAEWFGTFWTRHLDLAGIIHCDHYKPAGKNIRVLGPVSEAADIVRREEITRVLCTNQTINDPALCRTFCLLRYSGVTVMPLINLCEEVYHFAPLELVTPEWLLHASGSPHVFYIKKIKRGFDIIASLGGLLALGPFMLAGMLLTKLTSKGPVFYRQTRCGRFGKPFDVIKLRTMRTDAEKNGAVWSKANDDRVTPVGGFLRKYRIDEIPQIINVLRGEMSFVGPRPERPEFVEKLAQEIPYFGERLMVQPGITGWAQVNYPYGSTIEDAKRKLEYDLYYAKNMGLLMDIFILLDTVRTILRGDLHSGRKQVPIFNKTLRRTAAPASAEPRA